jgi:tetratricopeptide (TPR) repeat protein
VHRDVKPSNIIFVGGVPKLADIGLVAGVDDARSFVGTEGSVPPEGPGAPSADCYSLGKLLYELSTGHDRTAWPEPPADLARRPDRERLLELNAILHRACAPDPRHRYASAEAMLAEIELLQGGQSVKRRRTIRQRRAVCKKAGVGLAVLAVLATGVVILLQRLLRSELSSDGPPSTNMLANTLCAKAMLIIRGDNYAAFSEAYTNFNKAIVLDPNFARAYVGLLDLRSREFAPSLEPMTPQAMRDIAAKLKQLVPNLHSTYSADAEISWSDWDFTKAERFYLQAIKAAPDDERGHSGYGYYLMTVGRPIEARAHLEISLKLAPSKVTIFRVIGQSYHAQRDYTHAIEYYRKALELEPHHFVAYNMIGLAQVAMGDYPAAITNFEKGAILSGADEAETKQDSEDLRRALREGGVRGYWQELWKRTEKKPNDDFYSKAIIQNQLGETEEAFKWLNKSYETHERIGSGYETWLNYLLWHHWWDGLHDDPGFKALLDKVGFTKVMPARK